LDASGTPLELIVLIILLLLSAFFSGSETALFAANRLRMRQLAEEGHKRASLVVRLLEDPGRLLTTLLVGNNIVNIAASVLTTAILVAWFGPQRGSVYAILVLATVLLVIGEITPKTIAAKYADRLALLIAAPIRLVGVALYPIIRALSAVSYVLVRPLGGRVNLTSPLVTEDEIRLLIKMGEEEGVIQEDEREMIHSIFEWGDTVAREVMVPRIDVVAVEDTTSLDQVLRIVLEEGHSRIPVFRETIDEVIGVLYVKDLLSHLKAGRMQVQAKELMRQAYFIPETKRLDELFREMRRKKVHMAIVLDEYGGTAGLVTIEDLLEEIVGPILDEFDVDEEKQIETVDAHTTLVNGRMSVEEVNELLGLALPVEDVDTIGGFVYRLLGHIPVQGEAVPFDGLDISVERVDGNRITKIRIARREPTEPLRPS
jgi:putative hemolysin